MVVFFFVLEVRLKNKLNLVEDFLIFVALKLFDFVKEAARLHSKNKGIIAIDWGSLQTSIKGVVDAFKGHENDSRVGQLKSVVGCCKVPHVYDSFHRI